MGVNSVESKRLLEEQLLKALKANLPKLEVLLEESSSHWGLEDGFYRFYHCSMKVYRIQSDTLRIVEALKGLLPEAPLNSMFERIVQEGTGKSFEMEHNADWERHTRPMLEALFHARYFLELGCRYGRQLQTPPQPMPSGWAAFLYLFNLR